jgi:hypothetical protein
MYNNNYQYTNYNYYYAQPIDSKYTYDINNKINNEITYPITNNNNLNYYQASSNYQYQNNTPSYYYNYASKTPTPSPNKKPLIINNNNNYNQIKVISKSPEPYIRLYKKTYYTDNEFSINSNLNKNGKNHQVNLGINKIEKVNKLISLPNINIEKKEVKAKTPEPNLRKRNKKKNSKHRIKINKYITKTFMPLKTNENDDSSRINNINITNISPNINYGGYTKMTGLNNESLYNHNSNLSDLSSNNYYYNYINDYPNSYIINQFHKNNIYQNQNTTIEIQNKNKYNENHRKNRFENNYFNGFNTNIYEPSDDFNTAEFIIINLIGQGTFGKIYCVQWIKNNKLYAMKKLELQSSEELKEFQGKVKMVKKLYKETNHSGFIKILGDKFIPLYDYKCYCNYYIITELGERDSEKEIQLRFLHQKYYSEYELYQIIYQLVKTLSLMQRYNVSHRDIKPQNILIINGIYKICDFGEARVIDGNGLVIQHVRGSQLYMSPILFYAYNHNVSQVLHNTYKSDVFSLGMCILLAATLSGYTLYDIREIIDINTITKIIFNTLNGRYSKNFINLIIKMLQIDENLRMDFIELEKFISNIFKK